MLCLWGRSIAAASSSACHAVAVPHPLLSSPFLSSPCLPLPLQFRPERVKEIAERKFGLDGDSVLDNLLIAKCYNHEHQMELLKYVAAKITEDESPYRLVIIDSIMFNFRVEFSGRGELAERQQKLGEHMRFLGMYAREFNIAIVLTNQVRRVKGGWATCMEEGEWGDTGEWEGVAERGDGSWGGSLQIHYHLPFLAPPTPLLPLSCSRTRR